MHERKPDQQTMLGAITLANRAPSVRNAQPWHWLVGDTSIHLMARDLPARDPLLGCGAALHHLRVALAALGWRTIVHRLPNPGDPAHLASIGFTRHTPSREDVLLACVISRRRTDRRRYSSLPVPDEHLALMTALAARSGARLVPVTDGRTRHQLVRVLDPPGGVTNGDEPDGGELLALTTADDDLVSVLRAGEAASAVLLIATSLGLATCALTPAAPVRGCPHLVLRAGWAPTAVAPPRTPRRATEETVGYLPGTHHDRPGHSAVITMKSPWPP